MGMRLGQHFLTGTWAARALTNAVDVQDGEAIVEIGPGKGALTKELLSTGARVVAIEKDEALAARLEEQFAGEIRSGQLKIIADDVRNFEPAHLHLKRYVVAANIPYYITGEIIRQFLTTNRQPRAMALLVQKEVAERIIARDGKESILSLSVKAYGTPKLVAKVSRGNFSPPPSVDSAILLIRNISRDFFADVDEKRFFDVIHAGFASKRKQLAGNLKKHFGDSSALALANFPEKVRAEDLALAAWGKITAALTESSPSL